MIAHVANLSGSGALRLISCLAVGLSLAWLIESYVGLVRETGWFRRPAERARRIIDDDGKVL